MSDELISLFRNIDCEYWVEIMSRDDVVRVGYIAYELTPDKFAVSFGGRRTLQRPDDHFIRVSEEFHREMELNRKRVHS